MCGYCQETKSLNIIRSLERIVFRVLESLATRFIKKLTAMFDYVSSIVHEMSRYIVFDRRKCTQKRWSVDTEDPMSRLFFTSPFVSQFSFRKNTQQTLVREREECAPCDEVGCCFCTVSQFLLLCAENKEIVFAIWDAIWSLTRFRGALRENLYYVPRDCIFKQYFIEW